ncbi:MAG: S41 family peptidase, partial [Pyrinomonadaceae bacterium]
MSKKFGLVAAVLLVLGMTIIGGAFGQRQRSFFVSSTNVDIANKIESDYSAALQFIGANYAGDVDYEKANQAAIQGMLWTLDPHSTFFPQAEFRKLREDQDSRFYGIGVSILRHRDGVYVQSAVPNTPAAQAGLRYGDRIVEIDGQDTRDWGADKVSKAVRGDLGKSVKIKVERTNLPSPFEVTIVRAAVPLPSIRTVYMVRPGIGYVSLNNGFQHTTDSELQSAIASLKQQGMSQLVLDLRGNPGGLLDQAIDVVGQFIPRGQVVVSIRGREYNEPVIYKSNGTETESFPLVTLIDRFSASASEIVAGAIQDHGRGLIVGETSFGKALVQRVYSVPFGTGLTLTTGKYYTPYGRSIQRDYSNGSIYEYYTRHTALSEETKPVAPVVGPGIVNGGSHAAANVQPVPAPTPHPPSGPAVKTAAGRVFYGGGGITPDIEVSAIDYSSIVRRNIAELAFYFTRQLIAGQLSGLELYRVNAPRQNSFPSPTDLPVT